MPCCRPVCSAISSIAIPAPASPSPPAPLPRRSSRRCPGSSASLCSPSGAGRCIGSRSTATWRSRAGIWWSISAARRSPICYGRGSAASWPRAMRASTACASLRGCLRSIRRRRLTCPATPLSGARVAVLAAAHERAQVAPVLAALPAARRIDLVGRTDLLTAAALLRRAALFVGNDTGIMHIAAATGTPTLGLFGPSRPEQYAPWGPRTAVATTSLTYGELVGAPGYDHRTTDTLMDSLGVEAAEAAALRLWARAAGEAA